ncbi:MAG: hypothetical protein DRP82_04625 [Planctomycetota bacterium]|nr:MAG: hypothetical protein DRP82_04625 [Planctomycetota bacterium]
MGENKRGSRYGAVRAVAILLKVGCFLLLAAVLITLAGGRTALTEKISETFLKKLEEANKAMMDVVSKQADDEKASQLQRKLEETRRGAEESVQRMVNFALMGSAFFLIFIAVLLWAASDLLRLLINIEEQTRRLADSLASKQF